MKAKKTGCSQKEQPVRFSGIIPETLFAEILRLISRISHPG